MKDKIFEEYARIATSLQDMKKVLRSTINYHLLADALYWSDEFPPDFSNFAENCMRPVIRYRTTMILGNPDPKWEPYWHEAKIQFPNWIGFLLERTTENEKLNELYWKFKKSTGC